MSYAPTQRPFNPRSNSHSDMAHIREPVLHRHRKTVSTGGGRAWSEAEVRFYSCILIVFLLTRSQEAYLIETRERKMPYKHIAAQLKKTELACRLHYHQLSFGSKARRSASACHNSIHNHSMHDRSSLTPQPAPFRHSPPQQRQLPSFSPPASPPETIHPPSTSSTIDLSHKTILPKPITSPFARASTSSPRGLRLVTDDLSSHDNRSHYVDIARLDRLYDVHRLHFWSRIASEYGNNLSPATLEDAWRRAHSISTASNFPPTPRGSPQSSVMEAQPNILTTPFSAVNPDSSKFTAVNMGSGSQRERAGTPPNVWRERDRASIPRSSYTPQHSSSSSSTSATTTRDPQSQRGMSVNSLLTENKDVRSPAREKGIEEAMMEVDTAEGSSSVKREMSPPPARSTPAPEQGVASPIATAA